jgi:hypothetical protein
MAPHHQQKDADPRAQSCSPLQDAWTVDRSPSPACIGCLAVYRILSIGPCARHCCYGSCINGKEERRGWMRSTPERPASISTINSVPSAPIAKRPPSLPCTWSTWSRLGIAAVRLPVSRRDRPDSAAEDVLVPAFNADPAKDEQEPILAVVDDQAMGLGRSPMSPAEAAISGPVR